MTWRTHEHGQRNRPNVWWEHSKNFSFARKVQQKLLDSQTFRECLDMAPCEAKVVPTVRILDWGNLLFQRQHETWHETDLNASWIPFPSQYLLISIDYSWRFHGIQMITSSQVSQSYFLFGAKADSRLGHRLLQLQAPRCATLCQTSHDERRAESQMTRYAACLASLEKLKDWERSKLQYATIILYIYIL